MLRYFISRHPSKFRDIAYWMIEFNAFVLLLERENKNTNLFSKNKYILRCVYSKITTLSSAIQHAKPQKIDGKEETGRLNTRVPLPTLVHGNTAWNWKIKRKNNQKHIQQASKVVDAERNNIALNTTSNWMAAFVSRCQLY